MPDPTTTPGRKLGHLARCLLLPAVAAMAAACTAGSGEGLDISGRPLSEGGDLPLAPTLESLQANLFDPFCITCHSGAAAPLGLRLDAGNSFNNLVGVGSRQSGRLRVEPGDPDASYLVQKLEGSASEGELMPLGGPRLPQSTIDFLRQWIIDGALPAGGGPPSGAAPRVTSIDPSPGSVLSSLPAGIDIGFDANIDASTVNTLTFELTASGGDGQFGNGNDVTVTPAAVTLSTVNPRLATMHLAGVTSGEDDYRVTIRGSGASVVMGVDGLRLDGEFAGSFPSGDGSEGGDFVAAFSVRGLTPTLESIQANVLGPTCAVSGCHSGPDGPTLPTGMDLTSADASFAALVSVSSRQDPAFQRVEPGDAGASYLVQKLEGNASAGARMPLGGPFLDPATVDVIRTWIDGGAPR